MDVREKVVIVTGAAGGIGRALCLRFRDEGATVVASDLEATATKRVARELNVVGIPCDVAAPGGVTSLVAQVIERWGRIGVFVSNAGVTRPGGVEASDADWQSLWDVNVMAHVRAARALVPVWRERGAPGWLVNVASAAGLLTEIGSAPYSVTKSAAVALAEWLAIEHHDEGIGVACVCPMGVATGFLDDEDPIHRFLAVTAVTPEDVADSVVRGLAEESFLILPHADVAEFHARKAADPERYLRAFRRLRTKLLRRR